ncbi:MAG: thiamine phosphate synthase, partial [Bradyrhizobium sp.]
MATKSVPPRPMPRLYLATPSIEDPSSLAESLPGLLAGADIAAVLAKLRPSDPRGKISCIKALAPAIQSAGAALLLDGESEL